MDVRALAAQVNDNLEQAARKARRDFFSKFLSGRLLDRIALGHTRSDQAETVLYRFLRGSGTAGLAGIRPRTEDGLVRPLVAVDRSDVIEFLAGRSIRWREDFTNSSVAFARNRIRHELLPGLSREWNPALVETLANTADWAFEEEAYWKREIDRLAAEILTVRRSSVLLPAGELTRLPRAAARRLVRRMVEMVKGDARGIGFQHVESVISLASREEGHGQVQIPGLSAFRSFEWIRLALPPQDALSERLWTAAASVPATVALPGGESSLVLDLVENFGLTHRGDSRYTGSEDWLEWERLTKPLAVRLWRPGDQYQRAGHGRQERLKVLFQEARIPLWERGMWPVLTCGGRIAWTRKFGPAAEFSPSEGCRVAVRVAEIIPA